MTEERAPTADGDGSVYQCVYRRKTDQAEAGTLTVTRFREQQTPAGAVQRTVTRCAATEVHPLPEAGDTAVYCDDSNTVRIATAKSTENGTLLAELMLTNAAAGHNMRMYPAVAKLLTGRL
ncbi:hypothetical protein AB0J55_43450 [Amycolatopsis sp. NPDC049688]|uniref:hypothetical protein n=1 Tax=Amycolatopsis sp. NPDC049688 TaxID=3154733 RepID=UPI0034286E2B